MSERTEFQRKVKSYFSHIKLNSLMRSLDKKLTDKEITPGQVIDHFKLWPHIKKDTQYAK